MPERKIQRTQNIRQRSPSKILIFSSIQNFILKIIRGHGKTADKSMQMNGLLLRGGIRFIRLCRFRYYIDMNLIMERIGSKSDATKKIIKVELGRVPGFGESGSVWDGNNYCNLHFDRSCFEYRKE